MSQILNQTINESKKLDGLDNLLNSHQRRKLLEARGSISSVDSDLSLSFDRRPSIESVEILLSNQNIDCEVSNEENNSETKENAEKINSSNIQDNDLEQQIIQQVEFYFSDDNISKDAFLLKHIKRNKEGFVSLKLVSSFKRVRYLTKDWRIVANALNKSDKLQFNEARTKIKRVEPLPLFIEKEYTKTIIVVDILVQIANIEHIAKVFSKCGNIMLIQILKPNNPKPVITQVFFSKNPCFKSSICAIVEFEEIDGMKKAIDCCSDTLQIFELEAMKTKLKNKSRELQEKFTFSNATRCCKLRDSSCPCSLWLERKMSSSSSSTNSSGKKSFEQDSFLLSGGLRRQSCSSCSTCSSCCTSRRCSVDFNASTFRARSNSDVFIYDHILRNPMGPSGMKGFCNINRRTSLPYSSKY